jgi:hypothetical protein
MIRITINQFLWLFFDAFHKANPFHAIDQASRANCKTGDICGIVDGSIFIDYHRSICFASTSKIGKILIFSEKIFNYFLLSNICFSNFPNILL